MNIVYACNEGYARHMAVSMLSLLDRNQRERELVVYLISLGITAESRDKLSSIASRYGRTLHIIEFDDLRQQFDYEIDTRGFDISAMARLFVGRLLPEHVKRVLYLDCDTVVTRSIRELWETDLSGNLLAAVMEPTIYDAVKEDIGFSKEDPYFNSGVLLIDLDRWRQTDAEKRILGFYQEKGGALFCCDQDAINGALKGEIRSVSPRFNFFPNYRYFSYRTLVHHAPWYGAVTREAFRKAKERPAVIHYAGDERPWIAGNLCHYRKPYDYYLAQSPWAGTPKVKGKELYMLLYHAMDYVTAVCPSVRWQISKRLGMKVVEARKS